MSLVQERNTSDIFKSRVHQWRWHLKAIPNCPLHFFPPCHFIYSPGLWTCICHLLNGSSGCLCDNGKPCKQRTRRTSVSFLAATQNATSRLLTLNCSLHTKLPVEFPMMNTSSFRRHCWIPMSLHSEARWGAFFFFIWTNASVSHLLLMKSAFTLQPTTYFLCQMCVLIQTKWRPISSLRLIIFHQVPTSSPDTRMI